MSDHLFKSSLFSFDEEVVSLYVEIVGIVFKMVTVPVKTSIGCLMTFLWNLDGSVLQSR